MSHIDRFELLVSDFRQALRSEASLRELRQLAEDIDDESMHVNERDLDWAIRRLTSQSIKIDLLPASQLVYALGFLVDWGGKIRPSFKAMLPYCKEAVRISAEYHRALNFAWEKAEEEQRSQLTEYQYETIQDEVAGRMPEERAVGNVLSFYCSGLLSASVFSKQVRQQLREDRDFMENLEEFHYMEDQSQGILYRVLRTLDDEEIIVLHPEEERGFRVVVSGISHNYQLHVLLADAIIGDPRDGWVDGDVPPGRVVAAARKWSWSEDDPPAKAAFDLQSWSAVQADGSVDKEPGKHVILHDAMPYDIPAFDNHRILVISEPENPTMWKAPRDFDEMIGDLYVAERMTKSDVRWWLQRLSGQAPRPKTEPVEEEVIFLQSEAITNLKLPDNETQ